MKLSTNNKIYSLIKTHPLITAALILGLCIVGLILPQGASNWQGTWDTTWRSGGATVSLHQDGDKITGSYNPYNGTIEGIIAADGSIQGNWTQPQSSGEFSFVMSPDGKTFSGRFDSGEWWNGERLHAAFEPRSLDPESLVSPKEAIRQFLYAGNWLSTGDHNFLDDLLLSTKLPESLDNAFYRVRGRYAKDFFDLVSHTTLRIFSFPAAVNANTYQHEIFTELHSFSYYLQFSKVDDNWQLVVPNKKDLAMLKTNLIEAGVFQVYNPLAHYQLASPRATLRTFLEGFRDWDDGGKERALSTMNFSESSEHVIHWEGQVSAQYLKRVLDRAGYITWQEIPNNLSEKVAFSHFNHPAGNIVIEAVIENEKPVWKFTPDTLKNIRALHDAIENLPVPKIIPTYNNNTAPFFLLRDVVIKVPGPWTHNVLSLEIWQWLGTTILLLLSWSAANLLRRQANKIATFILKQFFNNNFNANMIVGIPTSLLVLGTTWRYSFFIFGIPDYLFTYLRLFSEVLICIGVIWFIYSVVSEITKHLLAMADDTNSVTDDIIVTLLSSILKIAIIIPSALWLADILSIPYETVIAGLGIGGVAFAIAARDTIANFFGSAVILTDRPFGPGDLVKIDKYTGNIESVGLRSTRIRDEGDSLIFIPNSLVSKDIIVNSGRRDRTLIDESIPLASSTDSESIALVSEKIRDLLFNDAITDGRFLVVGVNNFTPGAIHLRLRFYVLEINRKIYLEEKHRLLSKAITLIESLNIKLAKNH